MTLLLLVLRWCHQMRHLGHRGVTGGLYLRIWPLWARRYSYIGCECGRVWLDRVHSSDMRAFINRHTRRG